MKKVLKSRLFFFLLGIFLMGIVSVNAVNLIYGKDVTYDNTLSGLSSTTVQGALDELYEKAKNAPSCNSDGECTVTCPAGKNFLVTKTGYKCVQSFTSSSIIKDAVTTGEGLYADSTEEGSFYYSGTNPNNDIVFNGEPYRILRIEKDGRIKIIKTIAITKMEWSYSETSEWRNSNLKVYLDDWIKKLENIEDYQFLETDNKWYVGHVKDYNYSNLENAYVEEKAASISNIIGLISVSEMLKSKENNNSFLEISNHWWTITKLDEATYNKTFAAYRNTVGAQLLYNNQNYVFPVLYLKSDTPLTGTGTSTDPYCIVGSNCPKNLDFTQRAS